MPSSVEGAPELVRNIRSRSRYVKGAEVKIGYAADYAIYVHENLEAVHPNGYAKFLEIPLQYMRRDLLKQIASRLRRGEPLPQVLYEAGQSILKASQELVPVDTGYLKSSGYVELEGVPRGSQGRPATNSGRERGRGK